MLRLGFVVAACLALVIQASANGPCAAMAYRDQNQVDTKIRIHDVKGVVIDGVSVPIPGVCVGVFAEPDHRLLATAKTDADGKFRLPSIGRGTYRLVAEYQGFGVANSLSSSESRAKSQSLFECEQPGLTAPAMSKKPSQGDNWHSWNLWKTSILAGMR
jgi:Carboxypeptidase regulatory-like domain